MNCYRSPPHRPLEHSRLKSLVRNRRLDVAYAFLRAVSPSLVTLSRTEIRSRYQTPRKPLWAGAAAHPYDSLVISGGYVALTPAVRIRIV